MKFKKMHGLGNDFIMLNEMQDCGDEYIALAKQICHRRTGIGADGLIIALPSEIADIRMRIINADGSEAEMCGNGIRCFAKYVYELGLVDKIEFTVETLAGIMSPKLHLNGDKVDQVVVDMGKPSFAMDLIPMKGETSINRSLNINGKEIEISAVLMGVPHAVVFVEDIEAVDLAKLGREIEINAVFPKKTNVNFVEIIDSKNIKVRTWERGAGATLACGTGSCASVVISHLLNKTADDVDVHLYLGKLKVKIAADKTVFMTGPASEIGILELSK